MTEFLLAAIFVCLAATAIAAQSQPCSSEQAKQFDFWVGTWDLEWTDAQGKKQKGTSVINKILGGCVIEENFNYTGESPLQGKSHSVFDVKTGKWRQTWVDSSADYIELSGGFKDGKMMLSRDSVDAQGKKIVQRMIFSNIQKDSFLWDWESSADRGKTWTTNWKINYRRKA